jgi:hypothetical protein
MLSQYSVYEDMDVLEVEVYAFSKGNLVGHFIVATGFCSIERAQKPEPVFTT